jgi:hypothetical protein
MNTPDSLTSLLPFLLRAKRSTYASSDDPAQAAAAAQTASRPASHDLGYREGDLFYLDTYLGGFRFLGEEAIWRAGQPCWGMNYYGTMTITSIPDGFSAFLKQALRQVSASAPYRGPEHFEQGPFTYTCRWEGDLQHFWGQESIALDEQIIYTLNFHGGEIV